MTMKDLTQIATIIHFYNNPTGRYSRFCRFCDHLQGSNINNFYCTFFGERCHEAVRKMCPLPTAGVAMLMESESVMSSHIQANMEGRKGGTVVPPSDFQSVSTESVHAQKVTSETPRPHGHTRAHSRKEPLAPTHFSGQLCGKTDCIYYGHRADYCEICTTDKQPVEKIYPDMCANEDIKIWKDITYYVLKEWNGIGQYLDNPALTEISMELQKRYGYVRRILQWDKEDEKTIHLACEFIKGRMSNPKDSINGIEYSELIRRLKSLKSKIH